MSLRELESLGRTLPYHDPRVTALIWELKYYGNRRAAWLCGNFIASQMLEAAADELGVPLLIPIPMHESRVRERGHNHTEVLCQAALPNINGAAEYTPKALRRTRNTPPQQSLSRSARLANVANSMEASPIVESRACIVVDDVATTDATLAEARRALMAAGARSVAFVVLARP